MRDTLFSEGRIPHGHIGNHLRLWKDRTCASCTLRAPFGRPVRIPSSILMSGRKSTLLIALLAVVLNVLSTPMAWARMSASMGDAPTSTTPSMEHCAGDEKATNSKQPSSPRGDHAPCCKGGPCTCGCLPAAVVSVPVVPRISVAPQSAEAQAFVAVPPDPVEDPLRPPIS